MKDKIQRSWVLRSIQKIEADFNRSADTHLLRVDFPAFPNIPFYFKDESVHPTGSLKHRLARSLFLYGLCNGWIKEGTTIIEASSGSTAVSEAYFAKLIGVPFIAVMPECTSQGKCEQIKFYGGKCHFVKEAKNIYAESEKLAKELNGHYMDQFTYAERATDWRGNNNIAESVFHQMSEEEFPIPRYIVCGAGTGGTSATFGRYVRLNLTDTEIVVVDPENSVFSKFHESGDNSITSEVGSRIEGIGRPRVEPSFVPSVVDQMIEVGDEESLACMMILEKVLGKKVGASTGTNFFGCLELAKKMKLSGTKGSVVTLLCDSGERYVSTYYNKSWLEEKGFSVQAVIKKIKREFEI